MDKRIINLFINKKILLIIFSLILFSSCSNFMSNDNDVVEREFFTIESQKEILDYSDTIEIVAKTNYEKSDICWYINGVSTSIYGEKLTFTPQDNAEKKYSIEARIESEDNLKNSNTINIYATRYPDLIKKVYEYIEEYNIKTSLSVSVYNKNTNFNINTGTVSLNDNIKNSSDTYHYLFSITKTFISALILDMVNEKSITLDTKLLDIIPEVDSMYININSTIEELLCHKSGIYDYVDNPQLFSNNPYRHYEWDPSYLLEYITIPAGEAGVFSYSSTNYILLGLVIEKIKNKKLNIILKEKFIEPLKLSSLLLMPQDDLDVSKISHGHLYPYTDLSLVGDGETPIDITSIIPDAISLLGKNSWSAGGMVGKVNDVAIWGYHLYSSNSNAIKNHIKEGIYNSVDGFTSQDSSPYGLGVRLIYNEDKRLLGSYGRSLGSENLMFYSPDYDTSFVILTSSNQSKTGKPNIDDLLKMLIKEVGNE